MMEYDAGYITFVRYGEIMRVSAYAVKVTMHTSEGSEDEEAISAEKPSFSSIGVGPPPMGVFVYLVLPVGRKRTAGRMCK